MTNLNSRLRKAREQMAKVIASKERAFFFRMSPEEMGESEKRFREENPDFDGEIIIYTLGTKNLNPYVPDANND